VARQLTTVRVTTHGQSLSGTRHAPSLVNDEKGSAMINAMSLTVDPMFLRHDLLIELGRLELAIQNVDDYQPANDLGTLQQRYATVRQTLNQICI